MRGMRFRVRLGRCASLRRVARALIEKAATGDSSARTDEGRQRFATGNSKI